MSRRISVDQLKPGMYISDLGAGWMSHSFLRNSFAVNDEAVVSRIVASGIRTLYIDPRRGLDVEEAPTDQEVDAAVELEMIEVARHAPPIPRISASEEMARARVVSSEARKIVRDVMTNVRVGRQIEAEQVEPIVDRITQSIFANGNALIYLARIKSKDDYTFQHSVAVCSLLVAFCHSLDMDGETVSHAGIGGLLHDIGKVRVVDAILNKPGSLTEQEFQTMKEHAALGASILRTAGSFHPTSILVAEQHHERYDGTGYPRGLAGDAISQIGQMAAIVDVYDAITSERVYRRPMAPHQAMAKIFEWSKFHFNPTLVHQFLRVIGIYPVGAMVRLESGRLAIVLEQSEESLLKPVVRAFYDSRHQHVIPPIEIDLSRSVGQGGGDCVVSHELPEKWGIDLARFL